MICEIRPLASVVRRYIRHTETVNIKDRLTCTRNVCAEIKRATGKGGSSPTQKLSFFIRKPDRFYVTPITPFSHCASETRVRFADHSQKRSKRHRGRMAGQLQSIHLRRPVAHSF